MTISALDLLYEQQIKPLPRIARLHLLARMAQDLATLDEGKDEQHHLLERERLGTSSVPAAEQRRSALDILHEAPGHRLFKSVEEVEAYLHAERDSWQ